MVRVLQGWVQIENTFRDFPTFISGQFLCKLFRVHVLEKTEAMIKRYVLKLTNLFTETTPYFEFVESCLRHKSEMVIYEAANAIVNLKRTTSRELIPAISVLQLFCSSPKATMRFAAVRTLNQVSFKRNKRGAMLIIFWNFF